MLKSKSFMGFHVKITTLERILDFFCPYKCRGCGRFGAALCGCCIFYITQTNHPQKTEKDLFVGGRRDGLLARLILEYKYNSVRGLARPLAEIMGWSLPDFSGKVFVVPLPTISKHIRARGFDHTALLAKELANLKGWEYLPLLLRKNNSVQVGASSEERVSQAAGAYKMNEKIAAEANKTAKILLVDDVTTTGASLAAAAEVLRKSGFKNISKVVIAKSNDVSSDEEETRDFQ